MAAQTIAYTNSSNNNAHNLLAGLLGTATMLASIVLFAKYFFKNPHQFIGAGMAGGALLGLSTWSFSQINRHTQHTGKKGPDDKKVFYHGTKTSRHQDHYGNLGAIGALGLMIVASGALISAIHGHTFAAKCWAIPTFALMGATLGFSQKCTDSVYTDKKDPSGSLAGYSLDKWD